MLFRSIKGNRFLFSKFDGPTTARAWARKLEEFLILHPVKEREVATIAALHLEGEANAWWFSHLNHTRVNYFSEFTQELIRTFDEEISEERRPTPPWEEASTSTAIALREQPSTSAVGSAITLEGGAFEAL